MKIVAFTKWIQSKPLEEMAKDIKAAGFDGVDMPVRSNAPINHENAFEKLPEAKRILNDYGLSLDSLVTGVMAAKPGLDELLELFASLDIRKIRLSGKSFSRGLNYRAVADKTRQELAELEIYLKRHGVQAYIQNHSGRSGESNIGMLMYYLQDRDPEWLGVQMDPGHLAVSGETIDIAVGLLGPYLHSVNAKSPRREPTFDPIKGKVSWPVIWVPLWDGMVDWEEVLQELSQAGYKGSISIHAEYRSPYYIAEHDIEYTTGTIAKDCDYLRRLIAKASL